MRNFIIGLLLLIAIALWCDKPSVTGWYWISLEGKESIVVYYDQAIGQILFPGSASTLPVGNLKPDVKWQGPIFPVKELPKSVL